MADQSVKMKAVIFSDIHGNQYAFREFLKNLKQLDFQVLVFCGDIYGYYYGQDEIIKKLCGMPGLLAVRGNHDEMAIQIWNKTLNITSELLNKYGHSYCALKKSGIAFVKNLPIRLETEIDGKKILIVHGTADDELFGRLYPNDRIDKTEELRNYDYVLCGHTHYKMHRIAENTVILNPGSIGQQRDGKGFGYAVIDFVTGKCEFQNIALNLCKLEKEIEKFDGNNIKLKEILHRGGF